MRTHTIRYALALITTMALSAQAHALAEDDNDFKPLVEGDDINQFQLVDIDSDTIAIKDGVVHITGLPNGYFATKDEYQNYVVRFEWMYERPDDLSSDAEFRGNSGVLIHIQGEHKVWPQCIEAQLQNRDAGRVFAINGAKFQGEIEAEQRQSAQREAIKVVGEWNEMEIVCKDGEITSEINGKLIDKGQGAEPDKGQIGWQSEGAPIQFRNLRIKVLD
ncbi:hypothetical protein BH23PLA1_BH23PLA1_36020 [soil metagenome]